LQFSLFTTQRPPRYTLFPYTTLFRSLRGMGGTVPPLPDSDRGRGASRPGASGQPRGRDAGTPAVAVSTHRAMTPESMAGAIEARSEEHTSELQSRGHLVCRLLLEKKK